MKRPRIQNPQHTSTKLLTAGLLGVVCAAAEPRLFNLSPDGTATVNSAVTSVQPGGLARLTLDDTRNLELLIGNTNVRIIKRRNHEVTFQVPGNAPEGCYVPLHVVRDRKVVAGSIPVAIAKSGNCELAPYQPSGSWLSKKTAIAGRIHGQDWSLENDAAVSTVDVVAAFFDSDATTLAPGPMLLFPPPGLCASGHRGYTRGTPTVDILLPLLFNDVTGQELDVGESLTVDDSRNLIRIQRVVGRSGLFWRTAASSKDEFQPLNTGGDLHLRVPGGRDVSPFVATLPPPAAFEWVNRPSSPVLNLRRDVPLTWKTASPGVVLVAAVAVDPGEAQFSFCLCVAPRQASQFGIPGRVLAGLVSSLGGFREAGGALYLIHLPEKPGLFSSEQLPTTAALSLQIISAKVVLRR